MWRPAKYDEQGKRCPPNNWVSYFGGSAWTWDEGTEEYYLHLFAIEQPDLNWENDHVRREIYDMIRWWLEQGVDGFRMDVINFISKEPGLPDARVTNPKSEFQSGHEFFAAGPRLHEFLGDIGKILKEFGAFSVGEMPAVSDLNEVLKAVGFDREELNMIFHFEMYGNPSTKPTRYQGTDITQTTASTSTALITTNFKQELGPSPNYAPSSLSGSAS